MVLGDGLGGHVGGEYAAELLVEVLLQDFKNVKQETITNPSAFMALSILRTHRVVTAYGEAQVPPMQPRTTCVICLVQDGYAYWAHVGDSRLYHLRNEQCLRRTIDHSGIEQLRVDGLISEEEMQSHPNKGRLLRCLGSPRKPVISLSEETLLQTNDSLLLCSDGLWEALTPNEISGYVYSEPFDENIEEMLLEAEDRMQGVSDNITAICFKYEDKVTTAPPLQANKAIQIDQDQIWNEAKHKILQQKMDNNSKRQKSKSKNSKLKKSKNGGKSSIDKEIEALEAYISRFEQK